ncbi:unnamed protein product [Gemmata massiliana]|uniref:Uncharacterized protein n=1 Tax=Gemmata massiliana TaxID=1210884 RepID=A0A6P2DD29_9BACT|nr:unnamed protein product [Gemmata massiliana]
MSTGDARKKTRTKGAYCADCRGHRMHTIRLCRSPNGAVTRDLVCSGCETITRFGLSCPKCGDVRLKTEYTRHRGGMTMRVKSCRGCGHRIRTRETVESGSVLN